MCVFFRMTNEDEKGFWDKARDAKQNSEGIVSYFITMASITSVTLVGTCCLILAAIVPFIAIVVGILKFDQCPVSKLIPVYLIAIGILGMISAFLNMGKQVTDDEKKQKCLSCLQCPVSFIWIGFFIAGNIWVFSVFSKVDTNHKIYGGTLNSNYCDPWVYWLAFALISVVYISIIIGILLCCVLCCFITRSKSDEETPIVDHDQHDHGKEQNGNQE